MMAVVALGSLRCGAGLVFVWFYGCGTRLVASDGAVTGTQTARGTLLAIHPGRAKLYDCEYH